MTLPSSPTVPPAPEPLHADPTQRSGAEEGAGRRAGTQLWGLRSSFMGPKVQSWSWFAATLPAFSETTRCWHLSIDSCPVQSLAWLPCCGLTCLSELTEPLPWNPAPPLLITPAVLSSSLCALLSTHCSLCQNVLLPLPHTPGCLWASELSSGESPP